jgi:two-component system nitrogen regulation sensor histidine kinase NtrY
MNTGLNLIKQLAWLGLLSALLLGAAYLFQQQGMSAVLLTLLLALCFVVVRLLSVHSMSKKRIEQVIRVLANNDPTLGLSPSDPLPAKLEQVRAQMQNSRLETQLKAQYFQTLLIHLDIAILVIDDEGQITQKNPASEHTYWLGVNFKYSNPVT